MIAAMQDVDLEVFRRYAGLSLPRHVSYPMPTWWHEVSADDVTHYFEESVNRAPEYGLSLYLHIPFCEALCKFCACNRVILRKSAAGASQRVDAYLHALECEIARLAGTAAAKRPLRQVHWGGGSPTYLEADAILHIQDTIRTTFAVAADAEVSMEIDPRTCPPDKLRHLKAMGFNRISMGVQDFDAKVQEHVRRVQTFELVQETVDACRELGFQSVNFDLIYGMPYQSVETIRDTVERTIRLNPDRVAYYHYAQIPEKIATQRGMDYTRLPDSETKLEMFLLGTELFEAAGYEFIGLDHFAKPEELLSKAMSDGTLQRNFQGMTTGGGLDLLGAGVSSISHLLDIGFVQNVREPDAYVDSVVSNGGAVQRGKRFTRDDLVRQALLNQLYCNAAIHPRSLEQRFGIKFQDYFAREIEIMAELRRDGLVAIDADGVIHATFPLGRVLIRNVAAVFDAYLEPDAYKVGDQYCFSANA